ncbi:protein O-GlcNAcase-like [Dreissena polymorpha]|nr:protein O-GlcNAcase-like [Dreissena polymorpha]XP_052226065.1 protein O-GlcNAcase-like [Dreissena polymorpha]XP_052226066.1 protein O-GlcNAcase-like [Dreissena polymorpha]XP_052226067.1 protein O-GlcNAcase-like [Dreissena polymorpha]XP_052226068.1 protein O-GlcNAcase-like [Dreissena polymorpha]XP_052226069.1 protein O-GlcNAcase-like [Dreissena polymorpha]XP_052226070.1 protein O-GlcNAcase-like [Dreissena polymorpha]XP_052226071.1 protein O-GlcNAcase-like [Dreissena polymorpha]XP_05222607
MTGSTEILDNQPRGKFVCGVVEGFYGIPWTTEQRKLLFQWMKTMGMTTYMYAPKDDAKHRAFWRDLYSVEEADNLTSLIEAATENNITLVYAISPGLDISFSSSKDVQCLKRKLEQVAAFGCRAFALLFDDIDPELSVSDKSAFQSSACAQVSITNEVYEHLGQPEFYFCPTEYCTSRAMPTLLTSGYLNTVGSKLLNDIHILWTGAKVISKRLTIAELEEVATVFRRPPTIWDNIHANDYDQRRLYLGAYDGRSTDIIPYLRGVLTNPNCEFEANYIPLHTLGQWSQSNQNAVKKDLIAENRLSPVISDIKLESECDFASDEDITNFDTKYQPKVALKNAIADWLVELNKARNPPKSVAVATTPCATTTAGALVPNMNLQPPVQAYNALATTNLPTTTVNPVDPSFLNPTSAVLVNSLVDPLSSPEGSPVHQQEFSDSDCENEVKPEPMDCVPSAITDSINVLTNNGVLPKNGSTDSLMQVEAAPTTSSLVEEVKQTAMELKENNVLTEGDLELLISFFHLPFEYAAVPVQMLQDLYWLKTNSHYLAGSSSQSSTTATEWMEVSDRFLGTVARFQNVLHLLRRAANQAVGYYFYPYMWDMLGVLQTCAGFVRWLGLGHISSPTGVQVQGLYTWMTKAYRDEFLSGDQEPWCFQGGLQAEFQRMLPIATAHDLLYIRHPEVILKKCYSYRPYRAADEAVLYNICLRTCNDGMDGTQLFPAHPQIIGDKLIGAMVTLTPEHCFVAEDDEGLMGYVVAALDSKQLCQRRTIAWTPAMRDKYTKPELITGLTPTEELILGFHSDQPELPECVSTPFPSVLRLDVLSDRMEDRAVTKRLLACCLCALRAQGSTGAHVELSVGDKCMLEHYRLLGFNVVKHSDNGKTVYLGRFL